MLGTPTTQDDLDTTHADMQMTAQMWVSGLITDREIADYFAEVAKRFNSAAINDLLDPNTGLRYGKGA